MKKKSLALAFATSLFPMSLCLAATELINPDENTKSVAVEFSQKQNPLILSLSNNQEPLPKSHDYCPGESKYCEDDEKCCQVGATTWCEKKDKSCNDFDK